MKKLRIDALVVFVGVVLLAGCERPTTAHVFPEATVREWEAARNARDADAMAEVYTEDAQVLPPNAPVIEGRAAIRTFYRNLFEARPETADFDQREIIVFGNITYRQGIYSVALPDGGTEYGKFIQLWKRVGDGWKLHRSMWSPNGPPLASPVAGVPPSPGA